MTRVLVIWFSIFTGTTKEKLPLVRHTRGGGHPVSSLAAKCRNLAASLMVRAEALVYSWRE